MGTLCICLLAKYRKYKLGNRGIRPFCATAVLRLYGSFLEVALNT